MDEEVCQQTETVVGITFPIKSSDHGDQVITVVDGKGEETKNFTIYRNLLCKAFEYFNNALSDGFKETTDGILKLLEDCPIYTKKAKVPTTEDPL
jgi:hypothetical protein